MSKRKFLCVVTHVYKNSVPKTSVDVQQSLSEEHSNSAENSQNMNFWLT